MITLELRRMRVVHFLAALGIEPIYVEPGADVVDDIVILMYPSNNPAVEPHHWFMTLTDLYCELDKRGWTSYNYITVKAITDQRIDIIVSQAGRENL